MGIALLVGLLLGVGALIDGGVKGTSGSGLPCQVAVTADVLDVRSSPSPNAGTVVALHRGDRRGALNKVINGYRQLADGWALDAYLKPIPGSECAS
jgi:hypothetical protein